MAYRRSFPHIVSGSTMIVTAIRIRAKCASRISAMFCHRNAVDAFDRSMWQRIVPSALSLLERRSPTSPY